MIAAATATFNIRSRRRSEPRSKTIPTRVAANGTTLNTYQRAHSLRGRKQAQFACLNRVSLLHVTMSGNTAVAVREPSQSNSASFLDGSGDTNSKNKNDR